LVCGVFVAGGRVLTGAADGSLALWPVGPGGPLWVSGAPDPAQPATVTSAASAAVGFDADTALVLLLNGQLQRVSLADGTREELPVGPVKAFTIAAEGLIVAGPEGRPRLVDPETGSVRAEFRTGRPMSALAFGPDGRLTELRTTPTGRLQDAETGRLLRHYPYPLAGVAVPVDRRHLLAGVGRGLGWLPWPDGGVP
jgi:hypothetical protein